ncbi:hypothetical protein Tb927.8.7960 [Trypanosoma brucei brucei TREU927]|uniref:T. brucei spp.-specific protein n=1 Tax=Trypanosoma brucei brucei (strain 927/4 GUTat10.1) TaxID=185431 RepID=Q57U49_TRYB2|nr:hypothetical protein Tb927.8.7960 [Trypanosoma brucei brucei TREU927]AAX70869.1 hypothetical protein Tb927.8.7960 [Trypanosoma brucei]AAZ13555.1 hypothetical protein Tb927.8.7960 [Trypanosoma brucei brucei TREU927]
MTNEPSEAATAPTPADLRHISPSPPRVRPQSSADMTSQLSFPCAYAARVYHVCTENSFCHPQPPDDVKLPMRPHSSGATYLGWIRNSLSGRLTANCYGQTNICSSKGCGINCGNQTIQRSSSSLPCTTATHPANSPAAFEEGNGDDVRDASAPVRRTNFSLARRLRLRGPLHYQRVVDVVRRLRVEGHLSNKECDESFNRLQHNGTNPCAVTNGIQDGRGVHHNILNCSEAATSTMFSPGQTQRESNSLNHARNSNSEPTGGENTGNNQKTECTYNLPNCVTGVIDGDAEVLDATADSSVTSGASVVDIVVLSNADGGDTAVMKMTRDVVVVATDVGVGVGAGLSNDVTTANVEARRRISPSTASLEKERRGGDDVVDAVGTAVDRSAGSVKGHNFNCTEFLPFNVVEGELLRNRRALEQLVTIFEGTLHEIRSACVAEDDGDDVG